jgi:hypothetical protein
MALPANLSFEETDGSPGGALHWVRVSSSTASGFGSYLDNATGKRRRAEKFTWYEPEYRKTGRIAGDLVAGNREGFADWNEGYIHAGTPMPPGNLTRGRVGVTLTNALGLPSESFGPPARSVMFSALGDTLTVEEGGPVPPIGIGLTLATSDTLPAPTDSISTYYVVARNVIAHTFKVSASFGGIPITFTDAGTGRHWTSVDGGWFAGQDKYRSIDGGGRWDGDVERGMYDSGANPSESFSSWVPDLDQYRDNGRLGGDVTSAPFDQNTQTSEKFRGVWPAAVSIVSVPGYDILCPVHTPQVDDVIVFTPDAPGDLAPLASGDSLYVVSSTPGVSFEVSATQGGSPISITDAGSGSIKADPDYGWSAPLG